MQSTPTPTPRPDGPHTPPIRGTRRAAGKPPLNRTRADAKRETMLLVMLAAIAALVFSALAMF